MSEKRFIYTTTIITDKKGYRKDYIWDNETLLHTEQIVAILNAQDEIIKELKKENEQLRKYNGQLKGRLEKINHGYGLLTHRKGLTANEWLIESQERELKKKNEQISDWIERHSKDIVTIGEQKITISRLEEENDNMNLFIKQTIEPLLFNCVFELNTIESMSQVELAKKIEEEIIPFIQDFKYLKYESLEEEKQDNI